jgi:hypothetical protein
MTPDSKGINPYRKTCPSCKQDKTPRAFRFARPAQLRSTCNECYLLALASDPTGKRLQTAEARRIINPATAAKVRAAMAARKARIRKKEAERKSTQMTEYHAARRNSGVPQ